VNVIRTCQKLGMTLFEIKGLKDRRTPELIDEVFTNQIEKIEGKIDEWIRARKLLLSLQKSLNSVTDVDEDAITVEFLPREEIVLGEQNDYSNGRTFFDALLSFYKSVGENYPGIDINYLIWGRFSAERIKKGDWCRADRFYFYSPEGRDERPQALYAVGYMRGGDSNGGALYKRMVEFIDKNNYEICGPAYEEFPLNEVFVSESSNYLMRVLITVRQKA